jgi:hypothetical protein
MSKTVTSLWVLMCKTVVFIERSAIEQLNTIIISSLGDVDFIQFFIEVSIHYMGVTTVMENATKMDDVGVPLFQETSIFLSPETPPYATLCNVMQVIKLNNAKYPGKWVCLKRWQPTN